MCALNRQLGGHAPENGTPPKASKSFSRLLMWGAFRLLSTRSKEVQMPIYKPSKKVDELYKGWLIFSPNVSRRSTGNALPQKDSATKPSQGPPTNEEEEVKP